MCDIFLCDKMCAPSQFLLFHNVLINCPTIPHYEFITYTDIQKGEKEKKVQSFSQKAKKVKTITFQAATRLLLSCVLVFVFPGLVLAQL